jgi:2'-5' RNA ligase
MEIAQNTSHVNQPEWHRLFVAVPIPDQVKTAIATAQAELKLMALDSGVAWTRAEHVHMTLKFLGNVAADRVNNLAGQMDIACHSFCPLDLRAEQVGAFPDIGFPRVIWIGVADNHGELTQLHKEIELVTSEFTKEEPEESFTPHATIGRAKRLSARNRELLSELLSKIRDRSFGQWTAGEIQLMRSVLSSQGARHECVARFHLGGGKPEQ